MATGDRDIPYGNQRFRLEVDRLTLGAFTEVTGLEPGGQVMEYRNGTDPNWVLKIPGLRTFENLTLKRGMTQNKELWIWFGNITNGTKDYRDGSIILMDEAQNDVLRWNFRQAWPNRIIGPAMNATGNEIAMESVELCHYGLHIEV